MRVLTAVFLCLSAGLALAQEKKAEPKAAVEGVVTLNGKPLAECMVVFHPAQPGKALLPFRTATDKDGKFKVELPADEYKVACLKIVVDEATKKAVTVTPSKYANPQTSGIQATVKDGKQTFDINLANK